jgi:ABC-type multidrug transport system fused ATPase/permease subunit
MDLFNDKISTNEGILYGFLIFASLLICTLIGHFYFWYSARIGLQMQIALRGLLYDKVILN